MRASTFVVVLSILVAALLGAAAAESARANGLVARVDARVQGLPPRKLLQSQPSDCTTKACLRADRRDAIAAAKEDRKTAIDAAKEVRDAAIETFKEQRTDARNDRKTAIETYKDAIQNAKAGPEADRRDAIAAAKEQRKTDIDTFKDAIQGARAARKSATQTFKDARKAAIDTFKDARKSATQTFKDAKCDSILPGSTSDGGVCKCDPDDNLIKVQGECVDCESILGGSSPDGGVCKCPDGQVSNEDDSDPTCGPA